MLLSALLALSTSAAATPITVGTPAVLYKCADAGGVTHYVSRPMDGADCKTMYYIYKGATVGMSPASILPECVDSSPGGARVLASPSARARECTRLRCEQPANIEAVRKYAMRQEQSAKDQYVGLTCITRKEQDLRSR